MWFLFISLFICIIGIPATPEDSYAIAFFGYEEFGGTYHDAEKSPVNFEDDLMCWAAAASNILAWSGWGKAMTYSSKPISELSGSDDRADQVFAYFQDHWTDAGGNMYFGIDWWFDGSNESQGWGGWSQVDVPGGEFFPSNNFNDYYFFDSYDYQALATIDTYLHQALGVGLNINGPGSHTITAWGYEYDDLGNYIGIYVTDSDDHKYEAGAPDELKYYAVSRNSGAWYLQDYFGSDSWYITEVHGLALYPGLVGSNDDGGGAAVSESFPINPVPEPATLLLLGVGLLGLAKIGRRNLFFKGLKK